MHIWGPRVTSQHRRCSNPCRRLPGLLLATAVCYHICCFSCQQADILQKRELCSRLCSCCVLCPLWVLRDCSSTTSWHLAA